MKKPKGQTSASALRALTRPPRGSLRRQDQEPSLSPAEWSREILGGAIPETRDARLRWPLPFETLSPSRTVGRPGTNLALIRATQFDSQESSSFPTGFASWETGEPGIILTRFKSESYGFSGAGTFLFSFTVRAVSNPVGFRFLTLGGTLIGAATVTVPANATRTVTATITDLPSATSADLFLEQISGGAWLWFKTTLREPGLVVWPPPDIVLG